MAAKQDDQDRTMELASSQRGGRDPQRRGGYQREGYGEAVAKSLLRSIAASLGRIIVRAITGRR